jgi:hypothetical protein
MKMPRTLKKAAGKSLVVASLMLMVILTIMSDTRQNQARTLSSAAQTQALKEKLRSLRWQPDAVMREVGLIQRLRALMSSRSIGGGGDVGRH